MVKTILVFVPNSLPFNKNGYLEGFYKEYEDCQAYYITSDVLETERNVIGYVGPYKGFKTAFWWNSTVPVNLVNYNPTNSDNLIRIVYDFKAFQKCRSLNHHIEYGVHFKFLSRNLRRKSDLNHQNPVLLTYFLNLVLIFSQFIKYQTYSAILSHFHDDLKTGKWLFEDILKEKRITPQGGNLILSKILDIIFGVILIVFFLDNESIIVNLIEELRETMVDNFRELLNYLRGSPIGLKLNQSFNNSLGQFFFYHLKLWRIFLIHLQPFLRDYFKYVVFLGTFGFSYQIALLSDLISLATFHVYCIYVYAARLTYLQLTALLSLWRLFIGRKYNPLRTRVDSHQYTHHQLFIGILGFTVLLFLLPTTALYYTVFVIFRVMVLISEEILIRIRYFQRCLPCYVFILFLLNSSELTGPVCLVPKISKGEIEAHLKKLSLFTCLKMFIPGVEKPKTRFSWVNTLKGVLI